MQATGIPNGNVQVHHQSTSKWNPPGGQNILPADGYSVGAMVLNLGALIDHTYSLQNGNLTLAELESATNTSTTRAITADIVSMQRSEEHTSGLQSLMRHLVCRLLLEKQHVEQNTTP